MKSCSHLIQVNLGYVSVKMGLVVRYRKLAKLSEEVVMGIDGIIKKGLIYCAHGWKTALPFNYDKNPEVAGQDSL